MQTAKTDASLGIELYTGDAVKVLSNRFSDHSIHSIITSPPYFQQRNYGSENQIGVERDIPRYINNLCNVFNECYRVLREDGTIWVNLGDTTLKGNELNLPFLFAEEMKNRGWFQKRWFPWLKRNSLPRGGPNCPNQSLEVIIMFAKKSSGFYYDQLSAKDEAGLITRNFRNGDSILIESEEDFWHFDVPTKRNMSNHFATFPPKLASIMLRASTSDYGVHPKTDEPIYRIKESIRKPTRTGNKVKQDGTNKANKDPRRHVTEVKHIGWDYDEQSYGSPCSAKVLDPFSGMATVGVVCIEHKRKYYGIDINENYVMSSWERLKEKASEYEPDLFENT